MGAEPLVLSHGSSLATLHSLSLGPCLDLLPPVLVPTTDKRVSSDSHEALPASSTFNSSHFSLNSVWSLYPGIRDPPRYSPNPPSSPDTTQTSQLKMDYTKSRTHALAHLPVPMHPLPPPPSWILPLPHPSLLLQGALSFPSL